MDMRRTIALVLVPLIILLGINSYFILNSKESVEETDNLMEERLNGYSQQVILEPNNQERRLIGFTAVPRSEFQKSKSLGALSVQLPGALSSLELQSNLDDA